MPLSDHPMWRKPQHHLDLENDNDHVHWVELFYDLIHVVAIFVMGNYLSHHLNLEGFFVFVVMFTAFWFAWAELSVYNSLFVSTDIYHRILMAMQIFTVMFMSAAIPEINGGGWVFFALAYAANRLILAGFYFRARRVGAERSSMTNTVMRNLTVFSAAFAISAFLPLPYGQWLFLALLVLNQALYMIPRFSIMRFERFVPRWGHISERFALLTLIVLGEGLFKLVVTLADKGIHEVSPSVLCNFFLGGISTFVMAWLYFDIIANQLTKTNSRSESIGLWLGHLTLMISAAMVGVAMAGEVKVDWSQPFPPGYTELGCFGLAGYILSLGILQAQIKPREAHRFARWDVKIFGIVLAIATIFIVPHTTSFFGNLLWGTALLSQLAWPLTRAWLTFSKETP